MQISPREFSEFRDFLKEVSGIDLGDNKQYLVATRIRRILLSNDFGSLSQLTRAIKELSNRKIREEVVNAMTTNETFWFRDIYPFEFVKKSFLSEFQQLHPHQKIRVWCAACSSGQEPYSLSMIVDEYQRSLYGRSAPSVEIVATDLSSKILNHAKSGIYDRLSMARGMSEQRMRLYFTKLENEMWQLKPEIKQRVFFRELNLQENFLSLGRFDLVFCRNVLIYFAPDLKLDILRRIHSVMKPGAFLFLGSSESLTETAEMFDLVHCSTGIMYRAKSL